MRVVARLHRPVRNAAVLGIAAVLLALLLWWLLDYVYWGAFDHRNWSGRERAYLSALAEQTAQENEKLREQVAFIERTIAIDRQTAREVQELVGQLQQQVFELTQENDFYRGILATRKLEQGLRIQGARVEDALGAGRYKFRLVLTHAVKDDRSATGEISIALQGNTSGVAVRLEAAELLGLDGKELKFDFKYFQRLEGTFTLPDGFVPRELLVIARETGRPGTVERSFSWQEVMN